jgi:ADP-heptose:LPS heptosyltransferase
MINIPDCKTFTGYKPCEPFKECLNCPDEKSYGTKILIINLDALGDVLVTTAVLPAIKRKYPESTIYWLTKQSSAPLLENNPIIDNLLIWNEDNRLTLSEMEFDVCFNADKNQHCCAFVNKIHAIEKYGFGLNSNGVIIPLSPGAEYNYRMGLEDQLKFKTNQRTGQDILAETFEIPFMRDEYVLELSEVEKDEVKLLRTQFGIKENDFVVGFNTGCATKFPFKKLTVEQHIELINLVTKRFPDLKILLVGGKEDTERNQKIKKNVTAEIIFTPTEHGLRHGILYEAVCDLIVSGDSLGMHIGIALKRYVLAWFGMTSHQEIDLYDRGEIIISDVPCAPCWSPVCLTGTLECIHKLDLNDFVEAIGRIHEQWQNQK